MHFSVPAAWSGASSLMAIDVAVRIKCRLPIRLTVHRAGGFQASPTPWSQRQSEDAGYSTNRLSASDQRWPAIRWKALGVSRRDMSRLLKFGLVTLALL